jgi:hypothetical protein
MQTIVKRGLLISLATFALAASAGVASADATASGTTTGSGGILSGNSIPIAVNIPINACGDAVGILGAAAATGNTCANAGGGAASATATSTDNPGILSGNAIPISLNIPINACGDAVGILGLGLSSANTCAITP